MGRPVTPGPGSADQLAVTVVIPARNAAATIDEQLAALAAQVHGNDVEVIVVDNDSVDDTAARALRWRDRIDGLRVVQAGTPYCVAHGRNVGFTEARHDIVLVCDADDVVGPSWIETMTGALLGADIVGGGTVHWRGGALPAGVPSAFGTGGFGFLDSFIGCNFGTRRSVWRAIDGFDEELSSCEDVDFAWRAQLDGFRLVTVPDAFVYYRVDSAPSHVFRKWRHYGVDQPVLYRRYAAAGMPRQRVHRSLARYAILVATSYRLVLGSPSARERWMQEAGRRVGRLIGSVRSGTVYL